MAFPLLIPALLFGGGIAVIAALSDESTVAPEQRGNFLHLPEDPLKKKSDPDWRPPQLEVIDGVIVEYGADILPEDIQFMEERMFMDATENPGLTFLLINEGELAESAIITKVGGEQRAVLLDDPLEFDDMYATALSNAQAATLP